AHSMEDGMDCCGHGYALTPRHWILSTAMASVGAMLTGHVGPSGSTAAAQTAETASAALDVVRKSIFVDVHTHGGKTGITSNGTGSSNPASSSQNSTRQGLTCDPVHTAKKFRPVFA